MAVSEKTGLRNIYFCITVDGQKHEIPAENARQANSIAEAKYGYAKIAVPPQESLVKKATDLEPIPVEDAMPERERRERAIRSFGALVQHPYKTPKPGSANLPCKECGLDVEAPEHRMHAKAPAKDSSKRDRLHRALDAVMDARGAARDAGSIGQHVQFKDPFTGKHESGEIVAKPARKPGDITGVWIVKTSTGKEIRVHEDRMRSVDSRRTARDAAGDYEVVWTDRAYKDHHKIFKNDSQGAPNNGEAKARKYAKQLESADSKDKYGNIRGPVNVRAVN